MWGIIFYQLWNYCGFGCVERDGGDARGAGGIGLRGIEIGMGF